MYKHFHPKTSKRLNFWSTTRHIIWVINDVGLWWSSAFSRQLTTYKYVHQFLIYLARHAHLSSSSSFSGFIMTSHKQCSQSRPCAPALCRELCSWMHDRMQHHCCHSFSISLRFDHFIYDLYDITDLYCVSEFCLQFSLNCLMWQ